MSGSRDRAAVYRAALLCALAAAAAACTHASGNGLRRELHCDVCHWMPIAVGARVRFTIKRQLYRSGWLPVSGGGASWRTIPLSAERSRARLADRSIGSVVEISRDPKSNSALHLWVRARKPGATRLLVSARSRQGSSAFEDAYRLRATIAQRIGLWCEHGASHFRANRSYPGLARSGFVVGEKLRCSVLPMSHLRRALDPSIFQDSSAPFRAREEFLDDVTAGGSIELERIRRRSRWGFVLRAVRPGSGWVRIGGAHPQKFRVGVLREDEVTRVAAYPLSTGDRSARRSFRTSLAETRHSRTRDAVLLRTITKDGRTAEAFAERVASSDASVLGVRPLGTHRPAGAVLLLPRRTGEVVLSATVAGIRYRWKVEVAP